MDKLSVLLVDDEKELVTTVAERLELRGYKADCVFSGADALEMAEKKKYDVMVIDVKMPGMNGLETMSKLKHKYPDIPVILLTGHGSVIDAEDGMLAGAFDYLMKPLDISDLLKKMHDAASSGVK